MYIDYFNKKWFKLKTTSYNDGKILHLDVTDADVPIRCRGCGSIKMKSLGGKTGAPGIYYDADVSPDGTWKFLYVTYHHNRGYKCQECNKKKPIKSKIPCKHQISPDLKKQIIKMLILDSSARKRTWAKLIEEYTICDFKEKADIYVINSCSVTNLSTRKTRQYLSRAKKMGTIVVLAGCYAQEIDKTKKLQNVDIIIGNQEKNDIVKIVEDYISLNKKDLVYKV